MNTSGRRPAEVSTRLGVSASTLRRWSQQFAPFLSAEANPAGEDAHRHRRYTDEDVATLITIKGLLSEGYAYDQVRRRLQALDVGDPDRADAYALVTSEEPTAVAPAVTVLADTLHTLADGQQMLLNSQQSNRDLLSMALQDNFNLKAENAKLRDRMLELERSLTETRRKEANRWETFDSRLRDLENTLDALVELTENRSREHRRGTWSRLIGR